MSSGFEYIDEIRQTWFVYATTGAASFSQAGGGPVFYRFGKPGEL